MKQLILRKSCPWTVPDGLMKRCVASEKFAFPVLRKSCVSPSPAEVSTFWSVGPSHLLNVNANVELKRGSKHNLSASLNCGAPPYHARQAQGQSRAPSHLVLLSEARWVHHSFLFLFLFFILFYAHHYLSISIYSILCLSYSLLILFHSLSFYIYIYI